MRATIQNTDTHFEVIIEINDNASITLRSAHNATKDELDEMGDAIEDLPYLIDEIVLKAKENAVRS